MIRKRPAKKAKNGYTYQVYFYYRDIFDKRKYYSKSGFLTKKEAQIHETEMKARLKEKGSSSPPKGCAANHRKRRTASSYSPL